MEELKAEILKLTNENLELNLANRLLLNEVENLKNEIQAMNEDAAGADL